MTAEHVSTMVNICRGGDGITLNLLETSNVIILVIFSIYEMLVFEKVYATRLVPGDIIAIPPTGCLMPCDAVLISGTCIVSESLLTGMIIFITVTLFIN